MDKLSPLGSRALIWVQGLGSSVPGFRAQSLGFRVHSLGCPVAYIFTLGVPGFLVDYK